MKVNQGSSYQAVVAEVAMAPNKSPEAFGKCAATIPRWLQATQIFAWLLSPSFSEACELQVLNEVSHSGPLKRKKIAGSQRFQGKPPILGAVDPPAKSLTVCFPHLHVR